MKEKFDFIFIESIEPRNNTRSVFIGYLFPVGAAIIERGYSEFSFFERLFYQRNNRRTRKL